LPRDAKNVESMRVIKLKAGTIISRTIISQINHGISADLTEFKEKDLCILWTTAVIS